MCQRASERPLAEVLAQVSHPVESVIEQQGCSLAL